MKSIFFLTIVLVCIVRLHAQELFVATEPASNMPRHSIGLRITNEGISQTDFKSRTSIGVMVGANKNIMLHANAYLSDFYQRKQKLEGFSFYGKYRFLNIDNIQKHFRGAFFIQHSIIKYPVIHDEINLEGENNGLLTGLVLTQLLHKLALSGSVSYIRSLDNRVSGHEMLHVNADKSIAYSFSTGYLIFPKTYTDYKQTNINLYLEFMGHTHPGTGINFMDAVPAVQFIFNSRVRMDLSKRRQLWGNMDRKFKNMYLIRLEYNLFNAF